MTEAEMKALNVGDLIVHVLDSLHTYQVTGNYGNRVTAVRTVDVTHASEWEVRLKAIHVNPQE